MTVYTLQAPMNEQDLTSGMRIQLEAIDPTTGAEVTGVTATAWAIYGENISAETDNLEDLIPRLTPQEVQEVRG